MTAIESTQAVFISERIHTDIIVGKNICPYSTLFVCIRFQVDKQIAVRFSGCVFKDLYKKFTAPGIHLAGEVCNLRDIAGIFKQDHIMSVQTHRAVLFTL
jgi:hypothetical protein